MRAFIIFLLFSVANADIEGYTYGTAPNGGYIAGGSNGVESIRSEAISGVNGGPAGGFFDGSFSGGAAVDENNRGFAAVSNSAPALFNNEFNKEFFTFSAPESEFEAPERIGEVSQSLKKNLRVVFIRAPENEGINNAALNLAKQVSEEKTVIYVLTKQPDVSDLANKLHQINNNINNKPEVHFVKYRTPEDAANAQQAIQRQYDNLGGSSHSQDGGVAPVLNFVSRGPAYSSHNSDGFGNFGAATSNSYIPPAPHVASGSSPSATYLPIAKLTA